MSTGAPVSHGATYRGVLEVLIIDWADHAKPSTRQYVLHADDGQRYNLVAANGLTSDWATDMRLTVKAQPLASSASASPGTIGLPTLPTLHVNVVAAASAAEPSRPRTAAGATAGNAPADMSVLFVILTVCTQKPQTTIQEASALYYNTPGSSTHTMQGLFEACSQNVTTMSRSASKVISVKLPCSGVTKKSLPWSADTCDIDALAEAADEAIVAGKLATLANYRFRQYLLPIENACEVNSWIGVANFGGRRSWMQSPGYGKWLDNCVHELGHNMFLDHASEDGLQYGDTSSIMGYGTGMTRCFNTPHSWQLGWSSPLLSLDSTTLAAGHTVTAVLPLSDTTTVNSVRIQADWAPGPVHTLWLGYRGDATGYNGYDSGLNPAYINKVHLYQLDGASRTVDRKSYHLYSASGEPGEEAWTWINGSLTIRVTGVAPAGASVSVCRAAGVNETSCGDGLDNDCDGLIDAADPDCGAIYSPVPSPGDSPSPSPPPPSTPALNGDPDNAYAVPGDACPSSYNDTIPAWTSYATSLSLEPCGPAYSLGGVFYTVGPITTPGTVIRVATRAPGGCQADSTNTVVSLFDLGSSNRTCLAFNDDTLNVNACSNLVYQVTAADVAAARVFLVRVALYSQQTFGAPVDVRVSLTCGVLPSPGPSPKRSPKASPKRSPKASPKASPKPSPCPKVPRATTYTFTVTNTLSWGATRNALRAALNAVYVKYNATFPRATTLAGPPGQNPSPSGTTTWHFTATVAIPEQKRCKPQGDKLRSALLKALAIPGYSIKGPSPKPSPKPSSPKRSPSKPSPKRSPPKPSPRGSPKPTPSPAPPGVDNPTTPTAAPVTCSAPYTAVLPLNSTYQTSQFLDRCNSTSIGGYYYSIGPFARAGRLLISTSSADNCTSTALDWDLTGKGTGDTVVALYARGATASAAPKCVAWNNDISSDYYYDNYNACSSIGYDITAADVKAARTFLVRVGLAYDTTIDRPHFGEEVTLKIGFLACFSPPSPPGIDNPNTPLVPPVTCAAPFNQSLPVDAIYQKKVVLPECAVAYDSYSSTPPTAGFYYSVGPFATTGVLSIRTANAAGNCSSFDAEGTAASDTALALYSDAGPGARKCLGANDDISNTNFCSALRHPVTASDVARHRKFLIRAGRPNDKNDEFPYFAEPVFLTITLTCT